jgi:hypothetical protein
VNYDSVVGTGTARIRVGNTEIASYDSLRVAPGSVAAHDEALKREVGAALAAAGYPASADPTQVDKPRIIAILTLLVVYVTMVYGPIAALLVELFPTRIRYTSMSLPYHIGNGWFGGLLPTLSFAIVAQTGNIYSGLWYPVAVAAGTCVIGLLLVRETHHRDIHHDH